MFNDLYFLLGTVNNINKRKLYYKPIYSSFMNLYSETHDINLDSGDTYIKGKISEDMDCELMIIITNNAIGGDIIFDSHGKPLFAWFMKDPLDTKHTDITLFEEYFHMIEYVMRGLDYGVNIHNCDQNSTVCNYLNGLPYLLSINLMLKAFPDSNLEKYLHETFGITLEDANDVMTISRHIFDEVPLYDAYKIGLIMKNTIDKKKKIKEEA